MCSASLVDIYPSSPSSIHLALSHTFRPQSLPHSRSLYPIMPHAEDYSEFTPDKYPPFPEDSGFPLVTLETISLAKLEADDTAEKDRAFEAFKTRGFVYLELAGTEKGETILHGADDICRVAEKTFGLPLEEKLKYKPQNKELFGSVVLTTCPNLPPLLTSTPQLQERRRNQRRQSRHARHGRFLQRQQKRHARLGRRHVARLALNRHGSETHARVLLSRSPRHRSTRPRHSSRCAGRPPQ